MSEVITIPTLKIVLLGDLGVGKTCIRSQFVHHIFTNAYKATIGGDYLTTSVEIKPLLNKPPRHLLLINNRNIDLENNNDNGNGNDNIKINNNGNGNENGNGNGNGSNDIENDFDQVSTTDKEFQRVNLQIWDTAGQERFNSISQAFYRGTDIVVLVYDTTNYESVLSLRNWFKKFVENCHVEHPGVIIVGNKTDKVNDRCVDMEEIREIITNNTDISVGAFVKNWDTDLIEICSKKLDNVNKVFERVAQLGLELMNNDDQTKIIGFDRIDLNEVIKKDGSACFC